ncbi:hypothetical protein RFI_17204 [Reticulomyxa filosa]|uniref:Transketolase N-terminal domain-containing protein n=1 Tax=Reticulomyxa filosa TaxID=46433 RepID=X6N172_RETFI|nr:hypothetical protein RFI_17204 [Reticulomyxa filosa]|eukprot:ETO20015.1 hypothetical protein RFI_17204 [Reticulomyxa filosa]
MSEAKFDNDDDLCIRTIRVLAPDMVEHANSGHPGAPMGLAPLGHVLWTRFLRTNPKHSKWLNRDRFVMSNGHACALQYVLLHLSGFQLSMDDLKKFRQLHSRTPGHPELGLTDGVEVTSGPLGQGFGQAVGLACASKHMAARFNKKNYDLFDHKVYVIVGDGCLQEGVSSEVASLAGHLQLNNLIAIYDDNSITIDGKTSLSFSEDVPKRFQAYGWETHVVSDGNCDIDAIQHTLRNAQTAQKPVLIVVKTKIGYGSSVEDSRHAHGSPLGKEALADYKRKNGFDPKQSFVVDEKVRKRYENTIAKRGEKAEREWNDLFDKRVVATHGTKKTARRLEEKAAIIQCQVIE